MESASPFNQKFASDLLAYFNKGGQLLQKYLESEINE
jgi:hypothetical protein